MRTKFGRRALPRWLRLELIYCLQILSHDLALPSGALREDEVRVTGAAEVASFGMLITTKTHENTYMSKTTKKTIN